MNWPLMALLLVLLLAIWLFIRSRRVTQSKEETPATQTSKANTAYHAVSIKFPSNACAAAREMEGRRFLSTAAPKLPLAGCQVLDCSCRFVHHKDRRTGKDRRSPFAPSGFGGGTGKFEQEMREGKDRRASTDDDLL
jgi:hypothetical protein